MKNSLSNFSKMFPQTWGTRINTLTVVYTVIGVNCKLYIFLLSFHLLALWGP